MRQRICVGLAAIVMLVIMGANLSVARGPQDPGDRGTIVASAASVAGAPWFIDRVDWPDVGESDVSVVIDPQSGRPYVSYYDQYGRDLRLATYVRSGGDCGPDDSWLCRTVDSEGDVGQYNSIAVYPGTPGSLVDRWKLGIAYHDATYFSLKFAEYRYVAFPSPGYRWFLSTIATGSNPDDCNGLYASLGYTSDGVPHIAYHHLNNPGPDHLMHAYPVDGGGNCGPDLGWLCDMVATGTRVGEYASLDIDSNDNPWIAFYFLRGYENEKQIGVARKEGASWSFVVGQDHEGTDGSQMSLVLGEGDTPRLAYYNLDNNTLDYARYVGAGGNCWYNYLSSQNEWQCEEIEYVGFYTGSRKVSLATDAAGYPIIAYQDASGARGPGAILKVARPRGALAFPLPYSGNCGPQFSPPPNLRLSWQCDTIDGVDLTSDVAASVSLAVNSAGLATIAYHEHRFMLPQSTDNLKVAYQQLQGFLPLVVKD